MFEQSLTYAALLRIKSFFGLYKTSLTHGLVSAIATFLQKLFLAYETSTAKKVIYRFASFIRGYFKCSLTRRYFLSNTEFARKYQSSLFYNFANRAVSGFISFSQKKAPIAKKYFQTTLTGAAYSKLHSFRFMRFEYMLGAFLIIMMMGI